MTPARFSARLDRDCSVIVPQRVREALQVGPGDEVVFNVRDGHVVLERRANVETLRAFLQAAPKRRNILPGELKQRCRQQLKSRRS